MHKDLIISDEAESDLEDIWDFIASDSVQNADRFIDQLYRKCLDIATLEGIGNPREELVDGLFSIPHKRYVIFFTKDEKTVSIVRIFRSSRDLESQFEN